MPASCQIFKPDPFGELLEAVYNRCGLDFRLYRKETIERRLARRIFSAGLTGYADYLLYLRENPEEYDQLIKTLTIKVSHFFRDPLVFEMLADLVIPKLIKEKIKKEEKYMSVWSAGCAHGQESYSLAMLFVELLQQRYPEFKTRIFASDIDREALTKARRGEYEEADLSEIKKGYLNKYFINTGNIYKIKKVIKDLVTYGYDNLVKDEPRGFVDGAAGSFDLILCRNVIIYLNRQAQEKVLHYFWRRLYSPGYLVLGKSESLPPALAKRAGEVFSGAKIYKKLF